MNIKSKSLRTLQFHPPKQRKVSKIDINQSPTTANGKRVFHLGDSESTKNLFTLGSSQTVFRTQKTLSKSKSREKTGVSPTRLRQKEQPIKSLGRNPKVPKKKSKKSALLKSQKLIHTAVKKIQKKPTNPPKKNPSPPKTVLGNHKRSPKLSPDSSPLVRRLKEMKKQKKKVDELYKKLKDDIKVSIPKPKKKNKNDLRESIEILHERVKSTKQLIEPTGVQLLNLKEEETLDWERANDFTRQSNLVEQFKKLLLEKHQKIEEKFLRNEELVQSGLNLLHTDEEELTPNENSKEHDLVSNENLREDDLISNENLREDDLVSNKNSREDDLVFNKNLREDDLVSNENSREDDLVFNKNLRGKDLVFNKNSKENDLVSNEDSKENDLVSNENSEKDNLISDEHSQEDDLIDYKNFLLKDLTSKSNFQEPDLYPNTHFPKDDLTTSKEFQKNPHDIFKEDDLFVSSSDSDQNENILSSPNSPQNISSGTSHESDSCIELSEVPEQIIMAEIANYLSLVSFQPPKSEEVDPSNEFVQEYTKTLFDNLKDLQQDLVVSVNSPADIDPLEILEIIENSGIGEMSTCPVFEMLIDDADREDIQSHLNPEGFSNRKIYMHMLFECVNEALNYIRPYGLDGPPLPWSKRPEKSTPFMSYKRIVETVTNDLCKWNGNLELDTNETKWVEYENEEIQIVTDLSDLIVEYICGEIPPLLEHLAIM